jgi:hypothetical protein
VSLQDAQKINIKPIVPAQIPFKPVYKYDITIVPIDLKYPDPQIKPLAMSPDQPFYINKGYVQAAYGIRKNPQLMAGYHHAKKDTYDAGFHLNAESLDNSKKTPYQQYSKTILDLYGNYMIKENTRLYGEINTSFIKKYFYHTDLTVSTLYDKNQSTRNINRYNITTGISNAEPTKYKFNYNVFLAIDNLSATNTSIRENGITTGVMGEKLFKNTSSLSIAAKYDYTAFNGLKELSQSVATIKPLLKTKIENLILHAGAQFLHSTTTGNRAFPEIYLSYGVAGPALQVFAGVHQDYYVNNFRNVMLRNPYLANNPDSIVNTVFRKYYGGVKGQFSLVTYQISAGLKDADKMMFMLNQPSDIRYFNMVFDDVKIIFLNANLDLAVNENISIGGWFTQNVFTLNTFTNAWHTPNIEGFTYAKLNFLDGKLHLKGDLYIGSKILYINKENIIKKSNTLFDLNTTVEYDISKKFNIFVMGNNLLNNRYERWYGYPSVGINALIGGKLIF